MKLFKVSKDGGPESTVTGYWLIEWKWFFSIVLLKFEPGSRDAYHSHAFNAVSWVLKGRLLEMIRISKKSFHYEHHEHHTPSIRPVWTPRSRTHKVVSYGVTWVLSLRGPWAEEWEEYNPSTGKTTRLGHGRVEL